MAFNFETIQQAHDHPVRSMVWSHNELFMISSDNGGIIKYWQPNMNNLKAFQGHKEVVRDLAYVLILDAHMLLVFVPPISNLPAVPMMVMSKFGILKPARRKEHWRVTVVMSKRVIGTHTIRLLPVVPRIIWSKFGTPNLVAALSICMKKLVNNNNF